MTERSPAGIELISCQADSLDNSFLNPYQSRYRVLYYSFASDALSDREYRVRLSSLRLCSHLSVAKSIVMSLSARSLILASTLHYPLIGGLSIELQTSSSTFPRCRETEGTKVDPASQTIFNKGSSMNSFNKDTHLFSTIMLSD
jgi:hypothetical protein